MSRITELQLEAFRSELRKEGSTFSGVAKSVGNFAKRQVHGVTGWTPRGFMNPAGIEEIGAGVAPAKRQLMEAMTHGDKKAIRLAKDSVSANQRVQDLGLTSLPGYAKALWNPATRKEVVPASIAQQFKGTPGWERAVTVGLPAVDLAANIATPDDPDHPTKGKRLGASIAGTAAGLATGSLPFVGSLAAGAAASAVGGELGKDVDKFRAVRRQVRKAPPRDMHVQPPPPPEESRGQSGPPVERNMSPSAAGQAPDWGGA